MAIPRVGIDVSNKADLVAFDSAINNQTFTVYGNAVQGDSTPRFYAYSSASTATVDGENVLDATGMGGMGRYLKLGQVPAAAKRQETYSGPTNASGNYTVTFVPAYAAAPNIQANIIGGSNTQTIKITSISTTGFTVNVTNRADVVGLLPSYSNVTGASVDVVITEK